MYRWLHTTEGRPIWWEWVSRSQYIQATTTGWREQQCGGWMRRRRRKKVTNRLWILFVICLSPLTSPPLDQLLFVVLAIVYFRNNRQPGVYQRLFFLLPVGLLGLFAQRNQLSNWKVTRQVIKCIYFPDAFVLIRLSIHRRRGPLPPLPLGGCGCCSYGWSGAPNSIEAGGEWLLSVEGPLKSYLSWTVLILIPIQMNRIITTRVVLLS